MWLIERFSDGVGRGRIPIPSPLRNALVRWYAGAGDAEDAAASIILVQQARIGGKWLACDCGGAADPPPILTPAFLSEAKTYYLRRLTGSIRPEHRDCCPFFRDQIVVPQLDSLEGRAPAVPPDGVFFEALGTNSEKRARRPFIDTRDDRRRPLSLPILARLQRQLLLVSGRTVIPDDRRKGAIGDEFRAVRLAAEQIEVAPGIALAKVLWTHASALESGRAFAMLRNLEPRWPPGHALQGFLLIFSREFHEYLVHPVEGEPIGTANRVQSPAAREHAVGLPYLVLLVIGQRLEVPGLAPLGAFAQPVLSGRRFVPLDDEAERSLLFNIMRARPALRRGGVSITIEKPVFDLITPAGPCRPRLLLDLVDNRTGECRQLVVAMPGDPDRLALATLGTVIELGDEVEPDMLARALIESERSRS